MLIGRDFIFEWYSIIFLAILHDDRVTVIDQEDVDHFFPSKQVVYGKLDSWSKQFALLVCCRSWLRLSHLFSVSRGIAARKRKLQSSN